MKHLDPKNCDAEINQLWDFVIVGAGPAGSVCASQLSKQGFKTLLVEKKSFPRYKICGCCLNERAISALKLAGMDETLAKLNPVPIKKFHLSSIKKNITLPMDQGVTVSRESMDTAFVETAISNGAKFLPTVSAKLQPQIDNSKTRKLDISFQGKQLAEIESKIVIIADGLGHPSIRHLDEFKTEVVSTSRIGMGTTIETVGQTEVDQNVYESGIIYMGVGKNGYVGAVRLEDGRLNIAAAIDSDFLKQHQTPNIAMIQLFEQSRLPLPDNLIDAVWHGTIPLTRTMKRPVSNRVFIAGDSNGYVEPFTGEGMAWAISDAVAISKLAPQGLDNWSLDLENSWINSHQKIVCGRLHWCRWLSKMLRSPQSIQISIRILSLFPSLARPIISRLNKPLLNP